MKLFVYGTLLQGLERAQVLRESAYLGPAMITGDLFDLGEYPGVRPGTGSVVGELYEIAENTLEQIDRIEGYDEHSPPRRCLSVKKLERRPSRAVTISQPFTTGTIVRMQAR